MKNLTALVLIMLIATPLFAAESGKEPPEVIIELLAQDEAKLDLGRAAIMVAHFVDEKVNAKELEKQLDALAAELVSKLKGKDTVSEKADAFLEFIFRDKGFMVQRADDKPNFLISDIIKVRRGACLGIAVFGAALAQRAGLPVHVVGVSGHVFLRFDDGDTYRNMEMLANGEGKSNIWYRKKWGFAKDAAGAGKYLSNLTKKETLGLLLLHVATDSFGYNKMEKVLSLAGPVMKVLPSYPDVYFHFAFLHSISGDTDKAIELYAKAARLNSRFASAWTSLGLEYGLKKEYEKAEEAFKKGAEADPGDPSAYYHLGGLYRKKGDMDKAVKAFLSALRVDPARHEAAISLALTLDGMNKKAEARAVFKDCIKAAPASGNLHWAYARFLIRQKEYEPALQSLRKARSLMPTSSLVHANLGEVLQELHRNEEALEAFRKAVRLEPDNAFLHYCVGDQLEKMLRWDDALTSLNQAVRLDPGSDLVRTSLAHLHLYLEHYSKAEKEFRSLLDKRPNSGYAVMCMAMFYHHKGERKKAEEFFKKALECDWEDKSHIKQQFGSFLFSTHRDREALELLEPIVDYEDFDYLNLWIYVLKLRLGKTEAALKGIREAHENIKHDEWLVAMTAHFAGKLSADALIAKAKDDDPYRHKEKLCEAYYYVAAAMLARGENKEKAVELLNKCRNLKIYFFFEHTFSINELEHLGKLKRAEF
jgi:tetratricopeptide (TPR) repeat protein